MKIEELKKMKVLKTKEDADRLIKSAINLSGAGKVIRTIMSDYNLFYKIEMICSHKRFLKLGKKGPTVLAGILLNTSITAAKYFVAVDELFQTIEINCYIGKDVHHISTPFDFLLELIDETISSDIISKWIKIINYRIMGGKK